jgi:sugar/nucleoside kinase (ribokinase family)
MSVLRIDENSPYQQVVGVGGIGTGFFFELEDNHTLGRSESRTGRLRDARDYCKLHIVLHYVAKLLAAGPARAAFHVVPIGKVGDDEAGRRLLQEMQDAGIDVSHVNFVVGKPTLFSVCFQYPDGEGGNITTSNSAAAELSSADLDRELPKLFGTTGKRTIALAAPEIPLSARWHFLELATSVGAFRAASFVAAEIPSARKQGFFRMLDFVSLNQEEAARLVGCELSTDKSRHFIDVCLAFQCSECPKLQMIVTAGKNGAYAFADGIYNYRQAPHVEVASSAGAGDALLGGVLAAIASGIPLLKPGRDEVSGVLLETALDIGVLLATYKCLSPHTIHPMASLDTLTQFASALGLKLEPAYLKTSQGP